MGLKGAVIWVCFGFMPLLASGQVKKKFSLPPSVSSRDYENGVVWVKLKNKHRDIFDDGNGARLSTKVAALSVEPLVGKQTSRSQKARIGPRKQKIDIALYYKLKFDIGKNIESYINELYATGFFETVEPIYAASSLLVPDDPSLSAQYYINLIKAPQAWDLVDVDESIVIGIVDTGGDLDHPDLQPNLYIDPVEPLDGIDNDGDGYIDNNRGWDFSGANLALIGTAGFKGDNDPSVNQGGGFSHGTEVAGCASASTNNGIGIASVGFSTKLLFTKHYADDQPAGNYSSNLYDGVLYAATHGARIINCSWGSYNPSTIAQDIMTYVTHDLNCLVVAAAGNSNLETPIYPASYDYVVSVANTNASDVRAPFSNYGKTIDITAPGVGILTTVHNDGYTTDSGTSLSAPIVAGAAALVWSKFPSLSALQVAEQLRVSADESIYANNPLYQYKLGKGRLDVERALTVQSPSIRASNQLMVTEAGTVPDPGDVARLYFDFTNYLQPSSGALKVTLESSSPYVTITNGVFNLGSMTENSTVRNTASPFELTLSESLPIDTRIEALLIFEDGDYEDFQLINLTISSYIDVKENNIITSITSAGRIGFGNTEEQTNGSGFIYNEESILFEMGLIMGTSAGDIHNNVRGTGGGYDQDFTPSSKITKYTPGERSYAEIAGDFINATDPDLATLSVSYRSLVWKDDPYRDLIILEYKVKNTASTPVTNFHFGLFADWDISTGGVADRASWDTDTRLGYAFTAQPAGKPHAGIQILSGDANYYAIDNDETIPGNPFGLYDGFTDNEKFTGVASGLARVEAGNAMTGNDISHVAASGPYSIDPGEEITIAFALHAALNKGAILTSAKYADSLYNYTLKAPVPVVEIEQACFGTEATLSPSGATTYKWYKDFTGGVPVFTGAQFTTPPLFNDTVLYVSNADNHYESLRVPAPVKVQALPVIQSLGELAFCEGSTVVLSTSDAEEYTWSTGQKTQSIEVGLSGEYALMVKNDGLECTSADMITVQVNARPSSIFTISPENPVAGKPVSFSITGGGGVAWIWDFGDGIVSTEPNPVHTYDELGDYTVVLTATSAEGCESESSILIGIITGMEGSPGLEFEVYPNPVKNDRIIVKMPSMKRTIESSLYNAQGSKVHNSKFAAVDQFTLDVSSCPEGIYLLKINTATETAVKKIIIRR